MSIKDSLMINENTDAGIARVLAMLGTAEGSESILEILGQTADTGGSTTAGTVMAKLNALSSNPRCVRHIQRGGGSLHYLSSESTTYTEITLSGFTDAQKMIAIMDGNTRGAYNDPLWVAGLEVNKLTIRRSGTGGASSNCNFSYQVVEFY